MRWKRKRGEGKKYEVKQRWRLARTDAGEAESNEAGE